MNHNPWTITNGKYLSEGRWVSDSLTFYDGTVSTQTSAAPLNYNAEGLYLLPGIVDLHGDAFERNISPRPGVFFDVETALLETDKQLLANGITTAYLAMTISWEPGLRSLDRAIELVNALQKLNSRLITDMRFQLRWEITALESADQVKKWLEMTPKPMLAFNDHFTNLLQSERQMAKLSQYASRAGLTEDEYLQQLDTVTNRSDEIAAAVQEMADTAIANQVVCLSHDEPSADVRRNHRELGITVCEFPLTTETAKEARTANEPIILGAPNVVRGGSHVGAVDASTAIKDGLCDVLTTDYFYATPLKAVCKLAENNPGQLVEFWKLISSNAAKAAGLSDRGSLSPGQRADALAISFENGTASIEAVFIKGQPHFISEPSRIQTLD
ncbi:MAG: alpha-D-ribose 1-methylphosphonate 5-triphosphate diphosphatase [Granulosicoccus sp.]|nr:alpha-D-ribose 1-methylphosphonate 5-triphosphate diphosphatase [Granulosicoccus sp.]